MILFAICHLMFLLMRVKSVQPKNLVSLLQDILWYVDGHHHVFKERATDLLACFKSFTLYNTPHFSKHRKRLTSNMSAEQLRDFALDLSIILQESYWEQPQWIEVKSHFIALADSLSSYPSI